MNLTSVCLGLISGILAGGIIFPANAQVISDGTTNTTVNPNDNNFNILNGIEKGNNLFHSFSNFSLPTGGSATFNLINTPNVTTIFSRVTGGNVSNIDGLIQTLNGNNPASLFLMNPNGIVFGENAKLDIGGSFVGTTANSIKFADGAEFSAVNTTSPLLTMSAPIGLQMGNNSAAIKAEGRGYKGYTSRVFFITGDADSTELRVKPGKTLALVGGNLQIDGFVLSAPEGQVELGSTNGTGQVNLVPNAQGYTFGYENGQIFDDIQLVERSLIDVSGVNSGSIRLQGRNILVSDGSLLYSENYGDLPGGELSLQASAAIDIIGRSDNGVVPSGLRSETYGIGIGGNIRVSAQKLTVKEGAGLNTIVARTADSGNIEINAQTIEVSGFSLINPDNVTGIGSLSFASGNAGDVFVNGDNLLISDGASISSVTFSTGSSGKVSIRNQHTRVIGNSPSGFDSAITLATFAFGNNQDLTLDTAKLEILDGGRIGSSTLFAGNGGNVNINASEEILISGSNSNNNSAINSSASRLNSQLNPIFGLPDLTANSGTLSITTPNLILADSGTVTVTSEGTGNAGNLNITADNIQLKNQSLIQAQTESGNGGDINLQVGNLLLMRDRSNITARASGAGDGGNININAPVITGLENSDIIANAVEGNGGNINITTQGIFGLEFSDEFTPQSDITASSEFGVSGTVQIDNFGVDPNSGLVELPANLVDASQQIAAGCAETSGSSFVATGRGGIPQNPTQDVRSDRTWSDVRNLNPYRQNSPVTAKISETLAPLVQATSWRRNAQGKIELVADKSIAPKPQLLTCATVTKN
ncbi:S-layer family protein [Nodularia harveyana UHCC-0300]|uniref:S-layer family protein n=1 Tax=Nodularia harveyana UHCC-0300 TaxID=2974287 RepID=A0ABU5UA70_9CYAN|nr:S-layer family protein [Nodularia harveyana]MEA5580050.1 S-layer family protein [Nodularia harveyana UHCC-0300]